MKFFTVIILILLGWCLKVTSKEIRTKTYYAVLEIEDSAFKNFTSFLEILNVTNNNYTIKNAALTKDCILNNTKLNCTCQNNNILSSEFVNQYKCTSNKQCSITASFPNMSCTPADKVIINGTLRTTNLNITSMYYGLKPDIFNTYLAKKLIDVFSTFDWFGNLQVRNVKQGSVIADFELLINAPITSTDLINNLDKLNRVQIITNIVVQGFITITSNDSIIELGCPVSTTCKSPESNIGNVTWYLLRDDGQKNITDGQQSRVYLTPNGSTLDILTATEAWKGTITCDFVDLKHSIKYRASRDLDIALLPSIFATSIPQFPDCRNSSSDVIVNIMCIIDNSTENYHVTWTAVNYFIGPLTFVGGINQIYYQATYSINCKNKNDFVNVTCIFTNRINKSANSTLQIKIINCNPVCSDPDSSWPLAKANSTAIMFCSSSEVGIMERNCTSNGLYGAINNKCIRGQVNDLLKNAMDLQNGIGFVNMSASNMFNDLRIFTESHNIDSFANINASVTVMLLMSDASKIQKTTMINTFTDIVKSSSNLLNDSLLKSWQAQGDQQNTTETLVTEFLKSLEGALNQTNITDKNDEADNVHTLTCENQQVCNSTFNVTITQTSFIIRAQSGIKNINSIIPNILNGNVLVPNEILLSVTPSNMSNTSVQNPFISLKFSVNRPKNVKMFCVYLDMNNGKWSDSGCEWGGANNPGECTCHHLSSFTILMSKTPVKLPYIEELTYVGLGFSICSLALGLVIEILVWNSVVKSNISHFKHTALVNIMLSLLIAHCCFLTSATPNPFAQWCLALTVMKHFCFLAVFCWMLCLSMGILHQMVFIFIHLRKKVYLGVCFSVGYILPFIIVIVTIITFNNGASGSYYDEENCWLRYDSMLKGSIHAFVLPVGIIVFVNMFTMVLVICTILKPTISEGKTQDEKDVVRSIIKSVVMLTPSLGITWIFGLLMMSIDLTDELFGPIVNYSFTFFNSFQGLFILLTGCFGEKKVRDELIKRFRKQKATKMRNESIVKTAAFKRK